MIYLDRARLVILSQPKTGSVALELALASRAAILFTNPPGLKHLTYAEFEKEIAPLIEAKKGAPRSSYDVVSVMRDPLASLGSWYRYRTSDAFKGEDNPRAANYSGDITFEQFVDAVCTPKGMPPPYARIARPCSVALDSSGKVAIDRLFPYEDLSGLHHLIEERTGAPLKVEQRNVSPVMDLELSEEGREKVEKTFAFEYALHHSLHPHGQIDPRFR